MRTRENFPVGSILIRRDLRPAVAAFYAFARAADDVADDPRLGVEAKLACLARFESGLGADAAGAPEGTALRARLAALGRLAAIAHARRLLDAFRMDALGARYAEWADLLWYCARSANPVGRFLLDLHGEGPAARPAADGLCTALQVLNHLQDLRADHERLGRLYLPTNWMAAAGARPQDLAAPRMTPALRQVVEQALDRCDRLLDDAQALPALVASPRLGGEARTTVHLARRLSARLRREDPLAKRVRLSGLDFARAGALGAGWAMRPQGLLPRAFVRRGRA